MEMDLVYDFNELKKKYIFTDFERKDQYYTTFKYLFFILFIFDKVSRQTRNIF